MEKKCLLDRFREKFKKMPKYIKVLKDHFQPTTPLSNSTFTQN